MRLPALVALTAAACSSAWAASKTVTLSDTNAARFARGLPPLKPGGRSCILHLQTVLTSPSPPMLASTSPGWQTQATTGWTFCCPRSSMIAWQIPDQQARILTRVSQSGRDLILGFDDLGVVPATVVLTVPHEYQGLYTANARYISWGSDGTQGYYGTSPVSPLFPGC